MNYVTFKIKETRDGQFILKLHNHHQGKVYEHFRSRNLDEVMDKLMTCPRFLYQFLS
jgi:hypothetical protein